MANELFFISIRWEGSTFNPPLIDAVLSTKGDWLRLHGWTWLLWSDTSTTQIREMLQKHLHKDDTIVVMNANPAGAEGWAPAWVWEWINEKINLKQGIDSLNPLESARLPRPPGGLGGPGQ